MLQGMNDTTIIICLLIALAAGALIVGIFFMRYNRDIDAPLIFDKNVDLQHYKPAREISPAMIVALILAIVALTSWATERDRQARAEERRAQVAAAPARAKGLKVTINRFKVVEIESGSCYAAANVAKGTTFSSCAD